MKHRIPPYQYTVRCLLLAHVSAGEQSKGRRMRIVATEAGKRASERCICFGITIHQTSSSTMRHLFSRNAAAARAPYRPSAPLNSGRAPALWLWARRPWTLPSFRPGPHAPLGLEDGDEYLSRSLIMAPRRDAGPSCPELSHSTRLPPRGRRRRRAVSSSTCGCGSKARPSARKLQADADLSAAAGGGASLRKKTKKSLEWRPWSAGKFGAMLLDPLASPGRSAV
ncbi:hypothetical protein SETIT_4G112600v2 [Setaria italica]|uniref:Uncharacterized protein n=1 Tax=Setaria italica TaxID=4555 RepID=A0A368QT36_SETIT|nr:hypothetical protein SETIT_4G112600v2 [Setaria italica]